MMKNCIIGQSGGPTVAINASLSGVISEATKSCRYDIIYGMINGIQGLLEKNLINLSEIFINEEKLKQLKQSPSMYLGSCRFKLPNYEKDSDIYTKIFDIFKEFHISDFFYIGGNDSMDTVLKLSDYAKQINYDINIIGIPKTIDNDLMLTDHTPGFGSAAKYIATSILEIAYDNIIYDIKSVTIVEIMGRNAGWLTASAALARTDYSNAPDLIYLPERVFDTDSFLEDIKECFKTKKNIVIAVSEGIKDKNGEYIASNPSNNILDTFGHATLSGVAKVLETLVKQNLGCKVRSIEMNVLQRSAGHIASKTDLDEAFEIGSGAVKLAIKGETAKMMIFTRAKKEIYSIDIDSVDIKNIANLEKTVPLEWINQRGNDIKQELCDYIKPLILGEVNLHYKNGIPNYISNLK